MNEKRFRVCCDDDLGDMWVVDIDTDEEYWTAPSLVDLLNEFAEENEQLKKELDSFKPVVFQDVRKGTVILYSKGDVDE